MTQAEDQDRAAPESRVAADGAWAAGGGLRRLRVRWALSSPLLRVAVQAAVIAVVAGVGFGFLSTRSDIDETAASILVGVVFGVATVLQLRQAQRRQHTVELLATFQAAELLAAADSWMATRISSRRRVDADVPADDERYAMTMLDYYEFMSSLALRGLVDVPLVMGQRGGTMSRCYELCRSYIEDRRGSVGGELYRSFEVFVDEYSRRSRSRRHYPAAVIARRASARPPAQRAGH
jgi:hypothetical protein